MKKYIIKQNLTDAEKYILSVRTLLRSKMAKGPIVVMLLPFFFVLLINLFPGLPGYAAFAALLTDWPFYIFPTILFFIFFVLPIILIKLKKTGEFIYEFDDYAMRILTDKRNFEISWGDITHYSELSKYILIIPGGSDLNPQIIPKKGFKDQNEVKEFVNFLIDLGLKKR